MNIFIFGANWYNRGDESALRAMIDELKSMYSNCNFKIHFNQTVDTIPYSDIEIISPFHRPGRKHIVKSFLYYFTIVSGGKINVMPEIFKGAFNRFIDAIDWADLAIYAPGGPSIGDYYRQYHLVDMMYVIHRRKTPYIIYAPSMGPFSKNKMYIRKALEKAEMLCFREAISLEYYKSLKAHKKATVTLDSAFQHAINENANEKLFYEYIELKEYLEKYEKVIGITITDLAWHNEYRNSDISTKIQSAFKQFIVELDKRGFGVLFIPQLFGNNTDVPCMNQYMTNNSFMMDDNYDCYFQQYVISKLYAVVGMRYHSNIFSAKMGTPFISIAYEQKMHGFMEKAELSEYCISVNELSYKKLIDYFEKIENNYDKYKTSLMSSREKFQKASYHTTELVAEIIETKAIK